MGNGFFLFPPSRLLAAGVGGKKKFLWPSQRATLEEKMEIVKSSRKMIAQSIDKSIDTASGS